MKNAKNDELEAIKEGTKEAILEMLDARDVIREEQFFEAVKEGVCSAIWRIATNATDMPCAEFYEMVKQGVKEGMEDCTVNLND